ncbi:MAG: NAD-dependent epimerase/dehydratase family protein [Caulobacteraceae bacterium]|nr:NAD-dependent epimerase/dehydratase family protein [Caulobacteraceae bacterium]
MSDSVSTMASPPKRIFLTGGSGYVGRNLIRHFVGKGSTVVALARSPASAAAVQALGATSFSGDIFAAGLIDGMAGCDALIHAAADIDHGRGSAEQQRTNVDGTRHVFEAARRSGVGRALIISTESVLLDGSPLIDADETRPFPRRPVGAYSRSKGEAERLALSQAAPGFAAMAVRPRFVWGRDDTTALPQLVAAVTSGKFAWISGGHYPTSATHVVNLGVGVELALTRGRAGEVYFITDGQPVEFRTFVTGLLASQGISAPDKSMPRGVVRTVATIGDILGRLSDGRIKAPVSRQEFATSAVPVTLDIGKARRELGYAPTMTTAEGLAELADWSAIGAARAF